MAHGRLLADTDNIVYTANNGGKWSDLPVCYLLWGHTMRQDWGLSNSWSMWADAVDSGEWRANMDNGHRREVWVGGREKGSSEEKDGGSCSTVVVIKTHKTQGGWMLGSGINLNPGIKWSYRTFSWQMKQFKCIVFDFPELVHVHTYTNTIYTHSKNWDTYKFVIVFRVFFIIGT